MINTLLLLGIWKFCLFMHYYEVIFLRYKTKENSYHLQLQISGRGVLGVMDANEIRMHIQGCLPAS